LRAPRAKATTTAVPIVGQAPAGPAMIAEQNHEGWLRLPNEFLRPTSARHYLLRVRGNSMNRAAVTGGLIENGDLALVRHQASANDGDVVVALIDGEATIKTFLKGPDYGLLRPVSSESVHHPIVVKAGFRVQGVVRRVLKRGSELLTVVDETEE
jgi:repressor LexA